MYFSDNSRTNPAEVAQMDHHCSAQSGRGRLTHLCPAAHLSRRHLGHLAWCISCVPFARQRTSGTLADGQTSSQFRDSSWDHKFPTLSEVLDWIPRTPSISSPYTAGTFRNLSSLRMLSRTDCIELKYKFHASGVQMAPRLLASRPAHTLISTKQCPARKYRLVSYLRSSIWNVNFRWQATIS